MAVCSKELKKISICEVAKEAWNILEVTHEWTMIVKKSKLQLLTSKFEEIKRWNMKIFMTFILNSMILWIPCSILEKKLQLLKKAKVTTIEKSKDLDKIKVIGLVGSLQTYASCLPQTRKGKSIDLKFAKYQNISNEDNLSNEDVVFIARKFMTFFIQ